MQLAARGGRDKLFVLIKKWKILHFDFFWPYDCSRYDVRQRQVPAVKKEKQNGKKDSQEGQEARKREAVVTSGRPLVFPHRVVRKRAAPNGAALFLFRRVHSAH